MGMACLVVAASVAFMIAEDLNPMEALYFAVVTVTTVGYGDIHPTTGLGMIVCMIMILGGVGIFTGTIALITNVILSSRDRKAGRAKVQLLSEVFFRSIGTGLLERFTASNPQAEKLESKLSEASSWLEEDFRQAKKNLERADFVIDFNKVDTQEWCEFLESHAQVFLVLLGNPAISEGIGLTSVLRRAYHISLVVKRPPNASAHDIAELRRHLEDVYYDLTLLWLDYVAGLVREYAQLCRRLESTDPFKVRKT